MQGWNQIDLVTQALFWMTFVLWMNNMYGKKEEHAETLSRRYLPPSHPILLAECCFALASTAAVLRLLRWYIVHPIAGPLQTAFSRMGSRFKTVLLFVVWSTFTFSISMKIIYRPYEVLPEQQEAFLSVNDIKEMFLIYFGQGGDFGPDKLEMFTAERKYVDSKGIEQTVTNTHETTILFAKILSIIFSVVSLGFLHSALTGLFGSSAEAVFEAKELEWKFHRTREWLYYIQDSTFTPPFNLFPNISCVVGIFTWLSAFLCRSRYKDNRVAVCSCIQGCFVADIESGDAKDTKLQYPYLMRILFQRYFQQKQATEEDIEVSSISNVKGVIDAVHKLKRLSDTVITIRSTRASKA